MKNFRYLLILAGFGIVLSGCSLLVPPVEQTNNNSAMMQEDGDTIMKDEDDAMMEDSDAMVDDDSMMQEDDDAMMEDDDDTMMQDEDTMMQDESVSFSGAVLAGNTTPLLDFNRADYEKARAANKKIVLYFYANWCPVCKKEVESALYPAFNEFDDASIVGFRVNYNDNQTDADEEALAREFGVAYQHTKVILDENGNRVLKSPTSWSKSQYAEEVAKLDQ